MRYTRQMIGRELVIQLHRYRNDPDSYRVDVRGTIEKVGRGIATVRYQIPWQPRSEGYVTYLDGTETYVGKPF